MRPRRGRARVWILRGPSPGSELSFDRYAVRVAGGAGRPARGRSLRRARRGADPLASARGGRLRLRVLLPLDPLPVRWCVAREDAGHVAHGLRLHGGDDRTRASSCARLLPGCVLRPSPPGRPRTRCAALRLRGWILPLGLHRGNNSGPSSLMLALRFHKNYMESYKRVIKPPRFAAQWKSCPRKDFIRLSRRFQGPAVLLADCAMKKQ